MTVENEQTMGGCPVTGHGGVAPAGGGRRNTDWWPQMLNYKRSAPTFTAF